jgi:hypothetical protein
MLREQFTELVTGVQLFQFLGQGSVTHQLHPYKAKPSIQCMMAHRIFPPMPVIATHTDGRHIEFNSAGAAARWVLANQPNLTIKPDASTILRRVRSNQPLDGWSFQLSNASSPTTETNIVLQAVDPLTFVFGPEAADMFKNKSVRVTPDKKVSVFDVIKVVSGVENPRQTWDKVCHACAEVVSKTYKHMFTGQSRETLVTDIEGMLYIINLLPGANAAAFRAGGAKLLVRYLGGDESLIDEVHAIRDAHASGATHGTMSQLCVEAVESQAPNKYALLSPNMQGKDMHDFIGKEVCYLLTFVADGSSYIKFGRTTNVQNRMSEHMREIPGVQIYTMLETSQARKLEDAFKKKMKYCGYLIDVVVRGKKQTEIIRGINAHEAECVLVQLHDAMQTASDDEDCIRSKLRKKELEIEHERVRIIGKYLENHTVPPDVLVVMVKLLRG